LGLIEPQAAFANEIELAEISIARTNDLTELRAIHAQLFRGIDDWAGQMTSDLRDAGGSSADTPVLLERAIAVPDMRASVWDKWWGRLYHQGTLDPANGRACALERSFLAP
jgi:fido (protein-threonine AMPylation protein)